MKADKKIQDYSEVELKAFKCDCYEQIQVLQSNLTTINQELSARKKPEPKDDLKDDE